MKEPSLSRLTFADSGVYVCEASVTGLVRRSSFQLIVEGQQPVPPCFLDTGWVPPRSSFCWRKTSTEAGTLTGCCLSAGKPVITGLSKRRADDSASKVVTCEAEGAPQPSFQWNVNGTDVRLHPPTPGRVCCTCALVSSTASQSVTR